MTDERTRDPNFAQGDLCHFELPVKDSKRAKDFYGKVFGWKFEDHPEIDYTLFTTPGGKVGGGLLRPAPEMPYKVTNYLMVDSVDEAAQRVKKAGGKLLNEKTEVPGYGWMQHFEDPEGNLLALWQARPM